MTETGAQAENAEDGGAELEPRVEVYRVFEIDGTTRSVTCLGGKAWPTENPGQWMISDDGPREAAGMVATFQRWSVREIRGPGELSTKEQVALAFERGLSAMRKVAVEKCARTKMSREEFAQFPLDILRDIQSGASPYVSACTLVRYLIEHADLPKDEGAA